MHTDCDYIIRYIHMYIQGTGWSPLSTACSYGAVASAELLLEYGANPNGCNNVSEYHIVLCVVMSGPKTLHIHV